MMEQLLWRGIVVMTTAIFIASCELGLETKTNRPPAEVGGCWSIAGYEHCDTTDTFGYKGKYSDDELALRDQAKKITILQGALIGAVIGGTVGAVAGRDASSAAGGAVAGAAIGAIAGVYVANMQERYANKEDQLNAMVKDVRNSNRESEILIAKIQSVIVEDRRRLAAVQTRLAQGKATAAELEQERGRIWSNRTVVENAALSAKDQYRIFKDAIHQYQKKNPGTAVVGFEQELTGYRKNLDTIDRLAASMVKA